MSEEGSKSLGPATVLAVLVLMAAAMVVAGLAIWGLILALDWILAGSPLWAVIAFWSCVGVTAVAWATSHLAKWTRM